MKYIVVEAENDSLCGSHPSGLALTDGDGDEVVHLGRVGGVYESRKKAISVLKKYLKDVRDIISNSGELKPGWFVDYDCDDWSLVVYKMNMYGAPDMEGYEWVVKCDVIEIPEFDGEKEHNFCFLDIAQFWWR